MLCPQCKFEIQKCCVEVQEGQRQQRVKMVKTSTSETCTKNQIPGSNQEKMDPYRKGHRFWSHRPRLLDSGRPQSTWIWEESMFYQADQDRGDESTFPTGSSAYPSSTGG